MGQFLPVKWSHSLMKNAPTITAAWGSLTTFLDAVLINGFNSQTVTTLTQTSNVAIATLAAGHGFLVDQIINISGAAQADFNGDFRVKSITSTTVTFDILNNPTSPATGTILMKTPGLQTASNGYGFTTLFTGTNKRVFKSNNPASTGICLRIDNSLDAVWTTTYAKFGKVEMASSYSDIDTPVGTPAPFDPNLPTKNRVGTGSGATAVNGWYKWFTSIWYYTTGIPSTNAGFMAQASAVGSVNAETSGNRAWSLVGDDRGFYLFVDYGPGNGTIAGTIAYGKVMYTFTDFLSNKSGDTYNAVLTATDMYQTANFSYPNNAADYQTYSTLNLNFAGKVTLRDPLGAAPGLNNNVAFTSYSGITTLQAVSGAATGVPAVNGSDYSFILFPYYLVGTAPGVTGNCLRGTMPGIMFSANNQPLYDHAIIDTVSNFAGRKFMYVQTYTAQGGVGYVSYPASRVAFDITGPWY